MTDTNQTYNIRDINAQLANMGGTVNYNKIYQLPPRDQNPIFTQNAHPHTDLIRAVHNVYVRGVLEDALRRVNPGFEIKLRSDPSAAGASEPYQGYQIAGNIRQIFTDIDRKLLILGEPASGKTVLLLQLTEQLLQEAATNPRARVPVVVNLSSWAVKREPLEEWLVEELRKVYGASRKLSRELIGGNRLIYMLDGLDEVAEVYRADCLDAINTFIGPDTHLAVCSRITEYNALVGKLTINNAIELQPLDRTTFQGYLIDGGLSAEVAAELTDTLTADNAVWQQTRKPLFANVLIDTYADRTFIPPTSADADPLDRVYEIAVAPYITRQLDRDNKPYPDDKTRHYIAWMAWQMNQREMTSFYGEALQSNWGNHNNSTHQLPKINIERKIVYFLDEESINMGFIPGLFGGLVLGFGIGYRINFINNIFSGFIFGFIGSVLLGVIFSLLLGIIGGLIKSLRGTTNIADRTKLNQGFRETLNVSLLAAILFGLIFGSELNMTVAILGGLIAGTTFGFGDILRHLALRAVLHHTGQFPFNIIRFLHYTADLNLTRQVGGGMMFKHRYFQDYFAAQYERHHLAKDRGESP